MVGWITRWTVATGLSEEVNTGGLRTMAYLVDREALGLLQLASLVKGLFLEEERDVPSRLEEIVV